MILRQSSSGGIAAALVTAVCRRDRYRTRACAPAATTRLCTVSKIAPIAEGTIHRTWIGAARLTQLRTLETAMLRRGSDRAITAAAAASLASRPTFPALRLVVAFASSQMRKT